MMPTLDPQVVDTPGIALFLTVVEYQPVPIFRKKATG